MSDLWTAAILGVVEGLTEFLPVSSTGHLIVAGNLLNFTGEKAASFEVFIQLGAILAVVALFWRRFIGLIPWAGTERNNDTGFQGMRGLALLALTTLPGLVAGFLGHRMIKEYLFSPMTVAWALAIGAVGILLAERLKPPSLVKEIDALTYRQALAVGCFQCLALWPGMSRAAATIIGGMFSGLDRRSAAEYSFLAAVPIMVAATSYDLYKEWNFLQLSDFTFFAVGFVISFLAALAAVKTFISLVQTWSLAPFAWYRIAIAPIIFLIMK